MRRRFLVLALLIAGLVMLAPMASAVSPDPDNSAGLDLNSNSVVYGLSTGLADTTSGNTVQVGPVGGIYSGGMSTAGGSASAAAYSGACVLTSVTFTPLKGATIYSAASMTTSAPTGVQVSSSAITVLGANLVTDTAGDYIEFYDGTSRGDYTTCKLDLVGGTADNSKLYDGPPLSFSQLYVHNSSNVPYQIYSDGEEYIEIYDGTSRGTYSTCKLDIKSSYAQGTKIYDGASLEFATGIYVHSSSASNTWQVQYRIEDESE